MMQQPPKGQGLNIEADDYSLTYHTQYDASGRVISPMHRPIPDNTQHSQEKDIQPGGI